MKYLRALAFALLVSVGASTAEDLTGLWKAKSRFGPDARGPLIIQKEGTSYSAEILGRRVPVHLEAGEFAFELPARLGKFRGKLEGKDILGHWYRFGTPVNWSGSTWPVALSPLLLKPDGPNRWRGNVEPIQDDFTFFLHLGEKRPDDSLRAVRGLGAVRTCALPDRRALERIARHRQPRQRGILGIPSLHAAHVRRGAGREFLNVTAWM